MYTREHADDDPYGIADIHAYRGEVDEAFAWLDRAYSQRQAWLYFVKFNPDFNSLKGDSGIPAQDKSAGVGASRHNTSALQLPRSEADAHDWQLRVRLRQPVAKWRPTRRHAC